MSEDQKVVCCKDCIYWYRSNICGRVEVSADGNTYRMDSRRWYENDYCSKGEMKNE